MQRLSFPIRHLPNPVLERILTTFIRRGRHDQAKADAAIEAHRPDCGQQEAQKRSSGRSGPLM